MSRNFFGFEPKAHDERRIVPGRSIDRGARRRFDAPEHPLDMVEPGEVKSPFARGPALIPDLPIERKAA